VACNGRSPPPHFQHTKTGQEPLLRRSGQPRGLPLQYRHYCVRRPHNQIVDAGASGGRKPVCRTRIVKNWSSIGAGRCPTWKRSWPSTSPPRAARPKCGPKSSARCGDGCARNGIGPAPGRTRALRTTWSWQRPFSWPSPPVDAICRSSDRYRPANPTPPATNTIWPSPPSNKLTPANGREICRHTFTFDPDKLVDLEPQWLLEKAVPRHAYDPARGAEPRPPKQLQKKIAELESTAVASTPTSLAMGSGWPTSWNSTPTRAPLTLTLAMHPNAAPLWRLPWEYLHDGREFWGLTGRFHLNRQPAGLGDLTPEPVPCPCGSWSSFRARRPARAGHRRRDRRPARGAGRGAAARARPGRIRGRRPAGQYRGANSRL
jgi:hypothetical protein